VDLIGNTANSLWQVILVGLLLGAGLPTLFALGLRALGSRTVTDESGAAHTAAPGPVRRALAYGCFTIVGVVIVAGIVWIVVNGGH